MLTYAICILCRKRAATCGSDLLARGLRRREREPWHDPAEPPERVVDPLEQRRGPWGPGRAHVALEKADQPLAIALVEWLEPDEIAVHEPLVRVEDEGLAARHPRAEVAAVRPEHDHDPARHVLACVVADPL